MSDNIDLTKAAQRVAPAAKPALNLNVLPPGELVTPKSLTPGERKLLEAASWKDGDPVPANFADLHELAAAEARRSLHDLPPPQLPDGSLPQALVPPAELDVESLPAAEQERYLTVMRSVLQSAALHEQISNDPALGADIDPSVLAAIRQANGGPEVVDDRQSDRFDAGQEKQQAATAEPAAAEEEESPHLCRRCGWPQHVDDPIIVTDEDKDRFLTALLGRKPFVKEYSLYGGRLLLRLRTLTPNELDLCWQQTYQDRENNVIRTIIDQNERLLRYRTALQVIGMTGVSLPQSLSAWKESVSGLQEQDRLDGRADQLIGNIWQTFSQVLNSESMHRSVTNVVQEFNALVYKLEANSQSPDFYRPVGG